MEFKSGKSNRAVTTTVKVTKIGNMTLIDTPGTNDPDKIRPDRQIQNELINTIRYRLVSEFGGISSFTQCVMPNAAGRIKSSSIESMASIILSLTILYVDADPIKHPRMYVIFNDVSKNPHISNEKASYITES